MSVAKWALMAAAGVLAGMVLVRRCASSQKSTAAELAPGRWRAVTIYRSEDEIAPGGQYPQPLSELGDLIEIETRKAPGGKGTEVVARLRGGDPMGASAWVERLKGTDPRQAVRRALRESKQLIETGEIIRLNPKPEGRRPATPGGVLVDVVSKRSMGEGVL